MLARCLVPAALVALLGLVTACGGDDDPTPRPRGTPLWSDGRNLRDAEGRVVVLRGVNARVHGVFDVTFSDGRKPLEEIPPLTAADCARMRALGIDLLRLPINWSGVEPQKGAYDDAYLQRVDAAIACAADAGVLVIVDLHQDAYSKEIGEDGAPLWAIVPPPEKLLEGPLLDLGERRESRQVQKAFESFFKLGDPHGLQAAFTAMLRVVAARYANHPGVVGIELFNEPNIGAEEVWAFSAKAAAAVREAAPDKMIFFEPPDIRNIFEEILTPSNEPFAVEGAVYSPHIYSCIFNAPQCGDNPPYSRFESSIAAARAEADGWGTPLFIGEFGTGPETDDSWAGIQAELHDKYLASDAFWVWKEQSQGSWGLHQWNADGTWAERENVVRWISRVHPSRIAGEPTRVDYDWETQRLEIEIKSGTATEAPHLVYVPERLAAGYAVRCGGAEVAAPRDPKTGLVAAACKSVLFVGPK